MNNKIFIVDNYMYFMKTFNCNIWHTTKKKKNVTYDIIHYKNLNIMTMSLKIIQLLIFGRFKYLLSFLEVFN